MIMRWQTTFEFYDFENDIELTVRPVGTDGTQWKWSAWDYWEEDDPATFPREYADSFVDGCVQAELWYTEIWLPHYKATRERTPPMPKKEDAHE
jgi:hypothetical protein